MTLAEMERHPVFRRAFWRRNLYLAALLVLEILLLASLACLRISTQAGQYQLLDFDISFQPWRWGTLIRLIVNVAVVVGFSHYAFVQAFRGKGVIPLYPEDRSNGRQFGTLRGPEVVEIVQEMARALSVRRIDRIAVTEQPHPNAYTACILGLGNVVVLHSNLLTILSRQGVRSVVAHEVGHIRRRDSLLYQLLKVPRWAALVIAALALVKVVGGVLDSDSFLEFVARLSFLAVAGGLVCLAFALLQRLSNLAAQQTELMVDAYAAQVCGWHNHLNALLLMGERAEALAGYLEVIRTVAGRVDDELNEKSLMRLLNRLPAEELDAQRATETAAGLYLVDRLTMLREKLCLPLSDEEISSLAVRAAAGLRGRRPDDDSPAGEEGDEERQRQEKELRQKLLFWRDYDTDQVGYLDEKHLASLVADLRKQPDRMIFREFLQPDAQWKDHPTMRHRILFLADLFAPGAP
jgi:Zn-dependent protease with chaperone function